MKSIMLLGCGVLLLSSCAAEPPIVVPLVSPVNVMDATTPQNVLSHDNCLLKGQVLARTLDQGSPNNLLITQEELRVIKEKAAVLGANSVVIRANHVIYDNGRYVHVINADAYACLIP